MRLACQLVKVPFLIVSQQKATVVFDVALAVLPIWNNTFEYTRRSKSNPIELNFNRTQSNSIELNRWIEFDWVRQSNEIELTEK